MGAGGGRGRAHEQRAVGSWELDRVGADSALEPPEEPALPTPWFQPRETRWSF